MPCCHVHLAETQAELDLLQQSRTGPFVDFLQELQVWDLLGLIIAEPLEM